MSETALLAALVFLIFSIVCGAVIQWVVSLMRAYKPPVSILWFVFGMVICIIEIAVVPHHLVNGGDDDVIDVNPEKAFGLLGIGIAEAARIHSSLLYFIALPILLYDATQNISWHHFRKNVRVGLLLAITALFTYLTSIIIQVIIQVLVIGSLMQWTFNQVVTTGGSAASVSTTVRTLISFPFLFLKNAFASPAPLIGAWMHSQSTPVISTRNDGNLVPGNGDLFPLHDSLKLGNGDLYLGNGNLFPRDGDAHAGNADDLSLIVAADVLRDSFLNESLAAWDFAPQNDLSAIVDQNRLRGANKGGVGRDGSEGGGDSGVAHEDYEWGAYDWPYAEKSGRWRWVDPELRLRRDMAPSPGIDARANSRQLQGAKPVTASWSFSFMTASAVASTDPIAVISILEEMEAPPHFASLFDCEALINDGSSIFLFTFFKSLTRGSKSSIGHAIGEFANLLFTGPLMGVIIAFCMYRWLRHFHLHPFDETLAVILMGYFVFIGSEMYFGSSGPLGIVAYGLYFKAYAKAAFEAETMEVHQTISKGLSLAAECTVFVISGVASVRMIFDAITDRNNLEIPPDLVEIEQAGLGMRPLGGPTPASEGNGVRIDQLWRVPVFYLFMVFARFFMIGLFYPLIRRILGGFTWKEYILLAWGGLRGAVCLILALLIEQDPNISTTLTHTAALYIASAAFLVLFFNGITFEFLYKILKPYKPNPFRTIYLTKVLKYIDIEYVNEVALLQQHWLFRDSWALVQADRLVPRLSRAKLDPLGKIKFERVRVSGEMKSLTAEDLASCRPQKPMTHIMSLEAFPTTTPLAEPPQQQPAALTQILRMNGGPQLDLRANLDMLSKEAAPVAADVISRQVSKAHGRDEDAGASSDRDSSVTYHDYRESMSGQGFLIPAESPPPHPNSGTPPPKTAPPLSSPRLLTLSRQISASPRAQATPRLTGMPMARTALVSSGDKTMGPQHRGPAQHTPIHPDSQSPPEGGLPPHRGGVQIGHLSKIASQEMSPRRADTETPAEKGRGDPKKFFINVTDSPTMELSPMAATIPHPYSAMELGVQEMNSRNSRVTFHPSVSPTGLLEPVASVRRIPGYRQDFVARIRSEPNAGIFDVANLEHLSQGRMRASMSPALSGAADEDEMPNVDWSDAEHSNMIQRAVSVPDQFVSRSRLRTVSQAIARMDSSEQRQHGSREREGEILIMVTNTMRQLYKRMYEQSFISGNNFILFQSMGDVVEDFAVIDVEKKGAIRMWRQFLEIDRLVRAGKTVKDLENACQSVTSSEDEDESSAESDSADECLHADGGRVVDLTEVNLKGERAKRNSKPGQTAIDVAGRGGEEKIRSQGIQTVNAATDSDHASDLSSPPYLSKRSCKRVRQYKKVEKEKLAQQLENMTGFDIEYKLTERRLRRGQKRFVKVRRCVTQCRGGRTPPRNRFFTWIRRAWLKIWNLIGPRQIFPALDDLQLVCAFVDVHEEMLQRGDTGLRYVLGERMLSSYVRAVEHAKGRVAKLQHTYPDSLSYAMICHGGIFLVNLKMQLVEEFFERGLILAEDKDVILHALKEQLISITKYHPPFFST